MRLTTLLESHTLIEAGTTGLRTWNASFKFADWLVSNSGRLFLRDLMLNPEPSQM